LGEGKKSESALDDARGGGGLEPLTVRGRASFSAAAISRVTKRSSVTANASFPTLHKLCQRHPTENEQAQHRQYDHAIRRHRQIVWQLHTQDYLLW
jgi:hypothetical protein